MTRLNEIEAREKAANDGRCESPRVALCRADIAYLIQRVRELEALRDASDFLAHVAGLVESAWQRKGGNVQFTATEMKILRNAVDEVVAAVKKTKEQS